MNKKGEPFNHPHVSLGAIMSALPPRRLIAFMSAGTKERYSGPLH